MLIPPGASKSKVKSKSEASKPEASNSEKSNPTKRKLAATTSQADTISGVEGKSSTKKQKRTRDAPSTSTLGGLLSSGFEVASNAIQAVVDTVGSFTSGGDKSLLGDVTTVATGNVDIKKPGKKAMSGKRAGEKPKNSNLVPTSDDFNDFDETETSTALVSTGNDEDDVWKDDTIALRTAFDSGSEDDSPGDGGFKSGQVLPKLPSAKGLSKKLNESKQKPSEPGVIYVG